MGNLLFWLGIGAAQKGAGFTNTARILVCHAACWLKLTRSYFSLTARRIREIADGEEDTNNSPKRCAQCTTARSNLPTFKLVKRQLSSKQSLKRPICSPPEPLHTSNAFSSPPFHTPLSLPPF